MKSEIPLSRLHEVENVRVSCVALADICIDDRHLLLLHKKRLEREGERVLTPPGGGLEATDEGIDELIDRFGAYSFERGRDLRFTIHGAHADDLREWFVQSSHRESGVMRELGEELTEEYRLLQRSDLKSVTEEVSGYRAYTGRTTHEGYEGNLTLYLVEISRVVLPPVAAVDKLRYATESPNPFAYLCTDSEIRRGATQNGEAIGHISQTLLNQQRALHPFSSLCT